MIEGGGDEPKYPLNFITQTISTYNKAASGVDGGKSCLFCSFYLYAQLVYTEQSRVEYPSRIDHLHVQLRDISINSEEISVDYSVTKVIKITL